MTVSLNASNPSVRNSMKASSCSPSWMITCIMALSSATSVPGFWHRWRSACAVRGISLGSATIRLAPFFTALIILRAMRGCCSEVLDPITKIASDSSMSSWELVIAPLPNEETSPVTVLAWHSLAQWSTLLVPTAALASFCIR